MAKRPGAIHPESTVSISVKQALLVLAVVASAGSAFGLIIYNQSSTSQDVKSLYAASEKQEERRAKMAEEFMKMTREQNERREAMGKEFLASNREIVAKVGDLTTALAVQQTQARTTSDAMAKISAQLDAITRQLPQTRR